MSDLFFVNRSFETETKVKTFGKTILYLSLHFFPRIFPFGEIAELCRNCEWWLSGNSKTEKQEEKRQEMRIDGEKQGDPCSTSAWESELICSEGKDYQELAPDFVTCEEPSCRGHSQRNKEGRRASLGARLEKVTAMK